MLGSFGPVSDALAEWCEPKSHTREPLRPAIQATDTPRFMVLVDLAEKTAEPCAFSHPRARYYNALSARLQSGLHLLFVVSASSYRSGTAILVCHQNPVVLA